MSRHPNARRSARLFCPPKAARGSASWGALGTYSDRLPEGSELATGWPVAGAVASDVLFHCILLKFKSDHVQLFKNLLWLPFPEETKILTAA